MSSCAVEGCERRLYGRGFCNLHYQRWRKNGDPGPLAVLKLRRAGTCLAMDCDEPAFSRGWCTVHYERWRRVGGVARAPRKTGPAPRPKRICIVPGCAQVVDARGLCAGHYDRWRRTGEIGDSPLGTRPHMARRSNGHGYELVYRPGHPMADGRGYVLEHRLVMAEFLGRPLLPGEEVHHRNGDRADNRIGNLELWLGSHPPGQRVADLLPWAREVIERYDGML